MKCTLVLLTTSKLCPDQEGFDSEIDKLAAANQICSVGPDLYNHYSGIFHEYRGSLSEKHREILLRPHSPTDQRPSSGPTGTKRFVSLWREGKRYLYKGEKTISKGSNLKNFKAFAAAMAKINKDRTRVDESKIEWRVPGLSERIEIIEKLEEQGECKRTTARVLRL